MTKQEFTLFLKDLQKVREILTPEQAKQVPNLFPKVKEGKEIKKGQKFFVNDMLVEAVEDFTVENTMPSKWRIPVKRLGGR